MQNFPSAYDPKLVDPKWYQFWMDLNIFKANALSSKPPFCIVMPPPNVTGVLHMGHALVNTLQDVLIRWKRMSGYEVLWVPGTDHAGIATQTVVERHLIHTQGKRRVEFSRKNFLEHVWQWKEDNEATILGQLKKLGCSCDWSRLSFTMDEKLTKAVRIQFKKLYDEGLIYRGDYLVNWDPATETALADDEVEYEEKQGSLWHFKFPLQDKSGFITIATTRPETMLGDTAVAVSQKDPRYDHLIGKFVLHPLRNKPIPIIADHFVDPYFGTGALKITPAHDPNDYRMGLEHQLEFINVMTPNGKVNENGGQFQGMSFDEARHAIVEEMRRLGLLERIEPHSHRIGVSYRSKAVIEPYLSKQWFVKMEGFKAPLRALIEEKKVLLIPENWNNTYFHWIDNLRDWCISRQLWWGHRIPIWYNLKDQRILCYAESDVPEEVKEAPEEWAQDPDVLDTWFSSALWPFSTLGWPENTLELEKFYPNSTLITGHDILFFWVARMIAMGNHTLKAPPFPETFLHGLIYGKSYWRKGINGGISYVSNEERLAYDLGKPIPEDVQFKWEKMSKSKGNVIDPLEIIEDYGTDAMRMTLCRSASLAREIDLDRRRFEDFRNFTNKIWNGARFVLMNLFDEKNSLKDAELMEGLVIERLEDHWILSKIHTTIQEVNLKLSRYEFDLAATLAYDFFWKEFCAYYVEIAKSYLFGKIGTLEEKKTKQKLLLVILVQAIRILHPMAPFITEELFQILKTHFTNLKINNQDPLTKDCIEALNQISISVTSFPNKSFFSPKAEKDFQDLEEVIYTIRNMRGEMKLPPHHAIDIVFIGEELELIKANEHIFKALIKVCTITFHEKEPSLHFASMARIKNLKIVIPLPSELIQAEKVRLEKEMEKKEISIERLKQMLNNDAFLSRAPEALINKQRDQLSHEIKAREEINLKLHSLTSKN